MILKRIAKRILPMTLIRAMTNFRILAIDYGQCRTINKMVCVDRDGKDIPWYTYPAIEYLKQFDYSGKTVFEYGSGSSSRWWSEMCEKIISVEHDDKWFKAADSSKKNNQEIHLCQTKEEYISAIAAPKLAYDIIIVDGIYRKECAEEAIKYLKTGGMIIFDNSDWCPSCCKFLRSNGLIEVDFFGFGPINHYTWCTSLFFSREANFAPINDRQPRHPIGSIDELDESEKIC